MKDRQRDKQCYIRTHTQRHHKQDTLNHISSTHYDVLAREVDVFDGAGDGDGGLLDLGQGGVVPVWEGDADRTDKVGESINRCSGCLMLKGVIIETVSVRSD